ADEVVGAAGVGGWSGCLLVWAPAGWPASRSWTPGWTRAAHGRLGNGNRRVLRRIPDQRAQLRQPDLLEHLAGIRLDPLRRLLRIDPGWDLIGQQRQRRALLHRRLKTNARRDRVRQAFAADGGQRKPQPVLDVSRHLQEAAEELDPLRSEVLDQSLLSGRAHRSLDLVLDGGTQLVV